MCVSTFYMRLYEFYMFYIRLHEFYMFYDRFYMFYMRSSHLQCYTARPAALRSAERPRMQAQGTGKCVGGRASELGEKAHVGKVFFTWISGFFRISGLSL